MGNCLITKLNSVVIDESLSYLGGIVLDFAKIDNPTDDEKKFLTFAIIPKSGESFTLKVIGEGEFFINGASTGLTEKSYSSGVTLYANAIKLLISDKYSLATLDDRAPGNGDAVSIKASDLAYCDMSMISVSSWVVKGLTSDIVRGNNSITYINLGNKSELHGNVADFGYLPNIITLSLYNCPNISGSVETFVHRQRKIGRMSNPTNLTTRFQNSNITFGGQRVTWIDSLQWDATTITMGSRVINDDIIGDD